MTNTRNAPTPDASEGVATPPYRTYKTPTTINKNGSTLGITSNFSLSVGGVLFLKIAAEESHTETFTRAERCWLRAPLPSQTAGCKWLQAALCASHRLNASMKMKTIVKDSNTYSSK